MTHQDSSCGVLRTGFSFLTAVFARMDTFDRGAMPVTLSSLAPSDFMFFMEEKSEDRHVLYEAPAKQRAFRLMWSLVLAGMALLYVGRIVGLWTADLPVVAAWLGALLMGSCATYALYLSGPRRILVDTATRRYVLVKGFPFAPRTWNARLSDADCVCVEHGSIRTTVYFAVQLVLNPTSKDHCTLTIGHSSTQAGGETVARALSEQLGITYRAEGYVR